MKDYSIPNDDFRKIIEESSDNKKTRDYLLQQFDARFSLNDGGFNHAALVHMFYWTVKVLEEDELKRLKENK